MTQWLSLLVVALLGAAIAVQVWYLRGLTKAGIEASKTIKVISFVNIGLLSLLALFVLVRGVLGSLG